MRKRPAWWTEEKRWRALDSTSRRRRRRRRSCPSAQGAERNGTLSEITFFLPHPSPSLAIVNNNAHHVPQRAARLAPIARRGVVERRRHGIVVDKGTGNSSSASSRCCKKQRPTSSAQPGKHQKGGRRRKWVTSVAELARNSLSSASMGFLAVLVSLISVLLAYRTAARSYMASMHALGGTSPAALDVLAHIPLSDDLTRHRVSGTLAWVIWESESETFALCLSLLTLLLGLPLAAPRSSCVASTSSHALPLPAALRTACCDVSGDAPSAGRLLCAARVQSVRLIGRDRSSSFCTTGTAARTNRSTLSCPHPERAPLVP